MKNYVWIVTKKLITNKKYVFKWEYELKEVGIKSTIFFNVKSKIFKPKPFFNFHRDLCFYSEKEAYMALKKLIWKDETLENKRHKKEMKRLINEYKKINRKLEKVK